MTDKEDEVAGSAHLGVALAAKRVSPRTPLWLLVLSSYAIDLVCMLLVLAGKERLPARRGRTREAAVPPESYTNPWSHGLAMALAWTALFGFLAERLSHDRRRGALVSLLVFSHWLIDLVAKPMSAVFPNDSGLPLLFGGSRTVGLGLYRSRKMANLVEYGSLAVGVALCVQTLLSRRGPRRGS